MLGRLAHGRSAAAAYAGLLRKTVALEVTEAYALYGAARLVRADPDLYRYATPFLKAMGTAQRAARAAVAMAHRADIYRAGHRMSLRYARGAR